jgi:lipid A 3-O-deacylase
MILSKSLAACLLVQLLALNALAGGVNFHADTRAQQPESDIRFKQGHFELSLVTGALFSPVDFDFLPRSGTSFDYTQTEIRAGWMLNSPYDAGILSGNFEFLIGLGGGAVIYGPGTALANGDLFLRYNFVQRRAVIVPYVQIGAGLLVSDAAQDHSQRNIGRTIEGNLQTSLGVRILLNANWSLDLEGVFQHISNANTADRNVGVNALGGLVGVTREF